MENTINLDLEKLRKDLMKDETTSVDLGQADRDARLERLRRRVFDAKEITTVDRNGNERRNPSNFAGEIVGGVEWNPLSFGRWAPMKFMQYIEFCRKCEHRVTKESYDFFNRTRLGRYRFNSRAFCKKTSTHCSIKDKSYIRMLCSDFMPDGLTLEGLEKVLSVLADEYVDMPLILARVIDAFGSLEHFVDATRELESILRGWKQFTFVGIHSAEAAHMALDSALAKAPELGINVTFNDLNSLEELKQVYKELSNIFEKLGYYMIYTVFVAIESYREVDLLGYYRRQFSMRSNDTKNIAEQYRAIDEKLFGAEISIFENAESPFDAFIRMGMLYLARSVECIDGDRDFYEVSNEVLEFNGSVFEFVDKYYDSVLESANKYSGGRRRHRYSVSKADAF